MRAHLIGGTLLAAAALLLAACGESEAEVSPAAQPGAGTPPADGPTAAFETIELGDQSGISLEEPQVFRIDSASGWEEFWSRHGADQTPLPDLPPVDFSREMVIAVVDRGEPSGGYRFGITNIAESDGDLVVAVSKQVPGADCIVAAVVTHPFHIVRLAKSDAAPVLVVREESVPCASP